MNPSRRAGVDEMSQLMQAGKQEAKKRGEFLLPPPFVLFRPSPDGVGDAHPA